jgi:hypothetical protein
MFSVFESYFSTFDILFLTIEHHLESMYYSDPTITGYCFEEGIALSDCILKGVLNSMFEELIDPYYYLYDVWPEEAHYDYMPYIEYNELLSQYAKQKVDSIGPCNGGTWDIDYYIGTESRKTSLGINSAIEIVEGYGKLNLRSRTK